MKILGSALFSLILPFAAIAEESTFPTVSTSGKTTPEGGIEYNWTIDSTVSGEELMSVILLERHGGNKGRVRSGREALWYSKEPKEVQSKISLKVTPPQKSERRPGDWREVSLKGPGFHSYGIPIADTARVSVNAFHHPEDPTINAISIIVTGGAERLRFIIITRLSNINDHPRFMKEMSKFGSEDGPTPSFTYYDKMDNDEEAFAKWKAMTNIWRKNSDSRRTTKE